MRAPFTDLDTDYSEISTAVRPTAAVINLEALEHNFNEVVRRSAGRKILAVVKAQAYGHGAAAVSRRLLGLGVAMLGVALVEEGMELRQAGIDAPILVMGSLFPKQAEAIAALRLTPVVFTMDTARALSRAAQKLKTAVSVHVKIDSGMGRIGVTPEEAPEFIKLLRGFPGINVQGLMTHFADADLREKEFASKQMDRFDVLVRNLLESGIQVPLIHAANSAAVLDYQRALFTMVRPGLMLYGYNPLEAGAAPADLWPVAVTCDAYSLSQKGRRGHPHQLRTDVCHPARDSHCNAADRVRRWVQPGTFKQGRSAGEGQTGAGCRPGLHGHVHGGRYRSPRRCRGGRRCAHRKPGRRVDHGRRYCRENRNHPLRGALWHQ